jgi:hypothetical protein
MKNLMDIIHNPKQDIGLFKSTVKALARMMAQQTVTTLTKYKKSPDEWLETNPVARENMKYLMKEYPEFREYWKDLMPDLTGGGKPGASGGGAGGWRNRATPVGERP